MQITLQWRINSVFVFVLARDKLFKCIKKTRVLQDVTRVSAVCIRYFLHYTADRIFQSFLFLLYVKFDLKVDGTAGRMVSCRIGVVQKKKKRRKYS